MIPGRGGYSSLAVLTYSREHFSTPLHFATSRFGLDASLIPFPSGTGHMITALRGGEIDVGIGLTEGWIAGLGPKTAGGYADSILVSIKMHPQY